MVGAGDGVVASDCGAGWSSVATLPFSGCSSDVKGLGARNAGAGAVNGLEDTAAAPVGIIDWSVATGGTGSKCTYSTL